MTHKTTYNMNSRVINPKTIDARKHAKAVFGAFLNLGSHHPSTTPLIAYAVMFALIRNIPRAAIDAAAILETALLPDTSTICEKIDSIDGADPMDLSINTLNTGIKVNDPPNPPRKAPITPLIKHAVGIP
jgi:hypothetical protein